MSPTGVAVGPRLGLLPLLAGVTAVRPANVPIRSGLMLAGVPTVGAAYIAVGT